MTDSKGIYWYQNRHGEKEIWDYGKGFNFQTLNLFACENLVIGKLLDYIAANTAFNYYWMY